MKALAHPASSWYAVIQVSSAKDSPERVVLAYSDEKSLFKLIAEPSIIALGIAHREKAEAVVSGNFRMGIACKWMDRTSGGVIEDHKQTFGFPAWKRGLAAAFNCWKRRSLAYSAVQFAVASAVLVLYSKNLLSSAIRTMLGM